MRTFYIISSFLIIEMIRVCGCAAVTYDEYETAKLRAFLVQESAEWGKLNYQQLGVTSIYDINWDEIPGLGWNPTTLRLDWIEWSNRKLSGHLDVSGFLELRSLYCAFNLINSVAVKNCPSLINLDLYTNNLSEVDVSDIPSVRYLRLGYNNIRFIDLSNNPELIFLCCTNNQVESLDVSNHEMLETLYCIGNNLHMLITDNCVRLETLTCSQNVLTSLKLQNLPSLKDLSCFSNLLNDLQFFNCPSLANIDCYFNELPVLDVSGLNNLLVLDCSNNQLTSINIAGCNNLTALYCKNNLLPSLDVSNTPSLSTLICSFNRLSLQTLPPIKPSLRSYSYAPQLSIPLTCKYNDVDLSDINNIHGTISTFIWRNRHTVVTPLESNEGRFVFGESYIDDSLTCLVHNMYFPLLWTQFDVKFTGNGDSGNRNPEIEGLTVYAGEQAIHVTTEVQTVVRIYSFQGVLQMIRTVNVGPNHIPIERGIYVVVVNDTTSYKVIVR